MANKYTSFSLGDLEDLIGWLALRTMVPPKMPETPNSSGMWDEANTHIAAYNCGIRDMAFALKAELNKEEDDDE